jgi:outer membrane protein OmpA-like peptidoglycan-associated protein
MSGDTSARHPAPSITSEPRQTMSSFRFKTAMRRTAVASASSALCLYLGVGFAHAQADATTRSPVDRCATEARGRMADDCGPDRRAVEVNGANPIPSSSERELPKMTVVLGDERALRQETRTLEATVQADPSARAATSTARFASGGDLLNAQDRRALDTLAAQVQGRPKLRFEIVGHTDAQPIGRALQSRFPDNTALGLARAQAVARYLGDALSLPATAFDAQSRGPTRPLTEPAGDPAHWPMNRRVEVAVYWEEATPAVVHRFDSALQVDPTECQALTPIAPWAAGTPMRISIDGQPQAGAARSSADRQRCVDVSLERNDLRLQYDNLSQPRRLSAAAWPTVAVPGEVVRFAGYSNYLLFLSKAELQIFTANDVHQATPLATVPLDADLRGEWKVPAALMQQLAKAPDTKLYWRLRVYGKDGQFDETQDFSLTLAPRRRPVEGDNDEKKQLAKAYGESNLAVTNIPLRAGTITASGQGVRPDETVRALGFAVPVDENGRFVFQQLAPRRAQSAEIAVIQANGQAHVLRRDLDLPETDWFFVGQADLTIGRDRTTGPAPLVSNDPNRYNNETWSEGRLAFYSKGHLDERWQLTASVDTEERELGDLFRNLDRKDPSSLFRRFDPVDSWPTFGDDSTSIQDAPTQGRIYLRVDDGRSQAMWGNFKLNFGETELTRINRGLYGFHGLYLTDDATAFGEARFRADVFAAEPGTLAAREEFRGTGGSLYYLRNQDITRGAEQVYVEIRDRDSDFVLSRTQLVPVTDYEVDYLQGRVLLTSPLSSIASDSSLVRAGGLTGQHAFLVVSYEYTPLASNLDTLATGARLSWWATDALRLGVTGSRQKQIGITQSLGGADLVLRKSETTFLKAEVARTDGTGIGQTSSLDGGYSFNAGVLAPGQAIDANAYRFEAQSDFKEIGIDRDGRVSGYMQRRDAGFAAPGQLTANESTQFGVASVLSLNERTDVRLKLDRKDEVNGFNTDVAEAQLGYRLTPQWKIGTSLRYDDKGMDSVITSPLLPGSMRVEGERTDAAVQLDYDSLDRWSAYGFTQKSLRRTGTRLENDRVGFGGRYRFTDKLSVLGELSTGDGGGAGKAGLDYQYDDRSSVYMTYLRDTGRTDENTLGRGGSLVSGVKSRLADNLSLFTEHRQSTGVQPGLTHAYGVQYAPESRWTLGVSFENGTVGSETVGEVRREAVALTAGFSSDLVKYSGGAEYRKDSTLNESRKSWLLRNSITYKVNEDGRWVGKLNWADSDSTAGSLAAAKYTEAVWGYAYRPVFNDRLNLLLKYTYLFDLSSPGQSSFTDTTTQPVSTLGVDYQQRSSVVAIDATYDLSARWTVGGKYAWRRGELRASRDDSAEWFKSSAQLAIARVDWKVVRNWSWMAELRSLKAKELGDRKTGWLTAGYYHVNENFKVGVGYNFTDYSDNLTDLSYRSRGFFVNALGKF